MLVVGSFIVPMPPKTSDSATTVQNYFLDHRTGVRVSVYLLGVGLALFAWFLGTVRMHLRRAEGGEGRLSAVAFGGGLITLSLFGVGLIVEAALVFSARTAGAATTQALYDVFAVLSLVFSLWLVQQAGGSRRS